MPATAHSRGSDLYLQLVREFPLRRIRSRREYSRAMKMFRSVAVRYPQASQAVIDYMDLLAHLIDQYEHEAGMKVDLSHMTPEKIVKHLMEVGGLTVTALARQIGVNQGNLSEMLAGNRQFSKSAIIGLSERFRLSPALFFQQRVGSTKPAA